MQKKKSSELTKLYKFSVFLHIYHVKKLRRAVEIPLCLSYIKTLQGLNAQLRFSTLTEKAVSLVLQSVAHNIKLVSHPCSRYDNNITKNHEVQSDMMTSTLAICQTVF